MFKTDPKFWMRFWKSVASGRPDDCWEWQRPKPAKVYVTMDRGKGRHLHPARAVLARIINRVPTPKEFACHRCDNPDCVNPFHLFLGDAAVNADDRNQKKRTCSGTDAPNAILNEDKVRIILKSKASNRVLAHLLKVSEANINAVRKRRTWRHVSLT